MIGRNRRLVFPLLAGLAFGAGFTATIPQSGAQDAPQAFAAPHADMLLTRSLRRALPDGREIVATRSYAIRFVKQNRGFRVDGRLVDARVEAPPALQALAEIERGRPDPGMFPIRLDAAGMIVAGEPPQAGGAVERAAGAASREIAAAGMAAADMSQAQAFIRHVRDLPAASQWPADLFRPNTGRRSETREVSLSGGQTGLVTIEIAARTSGSNGLLASLERVVTTDLAGDKRVTRESWTLARTIAGSER